jgi:hypothetical protein
MINNKYVPDTDSWSQWLEKYKDETYDFCGVFDCMEINVDDITRIKEYIGEKHFIIVSFKNKKDRMIVYNEEKIEPEPEITVETKFNYIGSFGSF